MRTGYELAERLTTIGVVIAMVTGLVSPLSLLTSFYGMNVEEFVAGAPLSLFDFWKFGIPLLLLTGICFLLIVVYIWRRRL